MSHTRAYTFRDTPTDAEIFERFEDKIGGHARDTLAKTSPLANKNEYGTHFPFIPYRMTNFLQILRKLRTAFPVYPDPTFLDAGCGIGTKVRAAYDLTFRAHGIDLNTDYLLYATKVFDPGGYLSTSHPVFSQHDIITYPDYSAFDIIYFFNPLSERKLEVQFETHLAQSAKPGALIYGIRCHQHIEPPFTKELGYTYLGCNVWIRSQRGHRLNYLRRLLDSSRFNWQRHTRNKDWSIQTAIDPIALGM